MKVNIGSGKKYDPNYCNIDLYEDTLADRKMSAINLEFIDNTCEEVKAIHLIEHLGFFKALYALSEFFRILEPNGELISETPDIEKAFTHYLNSKYEQKKEILGWIFGIPHEGLQHKLCFPSELLLEMLKKIGFTEIKEKRYYNAESIPTLRINCKKALIENHLEVFQILAHIRKEMIERDIVNFKDSFLTKEQEDLLTFILKRLIEFNESNNKEILIDIIKNILIKSPQIGKIFIDVIKDKEFISYFEIQYFNEITDQLIEFKFPNILFHSLKKMPIIPGTQKFVLSSIELFGKSIVDKLLYSKNQKQIQLNTLKSLSEKLIINEITFFSSGILQRKSQEYFYRGIKECIKQNFKISKKLLLQSIQIYRDDFLYYWNLSKVFSILDLKSNALKNYRRTIKLLKISKVENKGIIKEDINIEIRDLKKGKISSSTRKPIISLDRYLTIE